jgi:uncharacterized membrane protein
MEQGLLFMVGAAYVVAPIALTAAVVIQARRSQALQAQVLRLATMVDALGRRVAAQAASQAAGEPLPTAQIAAAPPAGTPPPPARPPPPTESVQPPAPPAWPAPPPRPTWPLAPPPPGWRPAPAPAAQPPPTGWAPGPQEGSPPPAWPLPPPAPPPAPAKPFDWEAFVGVRLFSWVAGLSLLVAAVFFLRYSIESGWLGPAIRAAIGALTGVGLLVGAETGRARRYQVTAQALAGAGVAILFASVFAAHALWRLIPAGAAFALLALITAVAVAYAVRRSALVVALLGLLGGFATPLLLSTGQDQPIGLFSYLLVLDVGLAWVAHQRRWPLLGALSIGLTALYQIGWMLRFPGAHNLPIGMVIFLVFPALGFLTLALASRGGGRASLSPVTRWAVALGAIPPVLFLLHAAARPALAAEWPLVLGFALLLSAGLLLVAALQGPEWLHLAGAGGAVIAIGGVILGSDGRSYWAAPEARSGAGPWLLLPILALAALVLGGPRLLAWRGRPLTAEGRFGLFAAPALLGVLALLAFTLRHAGVEPGLVAAALLAVAAGTALLGARALAGPLLAATGLLAPWAVLGFEDLYDGAPGMALAGFGVALGLGVIGLGALLLSERRAGDRGLDPWIMVGAVALLVGGQLDGLVSLFVSGRQLDGPDELHLLIQFLLLGGLLAVAARTGRHAISVVAAVTTFLVTSGFGEDGRQAGQALLLGGALYLLQLLVPWWELRRGGSSRVVLWAPALASALFLLLFRVQLHRLEAGWLVGPVALLQALALVPHLLVLLRTPGALTTERSRLVVVAGAILALVTAAIPLQFEDEWITIGLALLAPALAWLHGRVPHRGLLIWVAGLALAVGVRLCLNDAVLDYHLRSGAPVWNFWLYAYGLPALAILAAARLLAGEDDRLLPGLPRLSPLLATLGGLLLFLLLNVEIADAFSPGTRVLLRLRGSLAYDLALTIGWACFAIALLAVGVALRSKAARVASIVLLAVTVLKCFLLDLGRLDGLFRVASFVGLAVSLALVAVVLQKFVLSDPERQP